MSVRLGGTLLALLLAFGATAEPQGPMTANEAIDRAGLQRMLTQRILKAYCQLGLGELNGKPQEQLNQAVRTFDDNLVRLDAYAGEPAVKEAVGKVKDTWPSYKELALKPPTESNAAAMLEINRRLLPLTHAVVVEMEKSSGTFAGKWVNIAGRQRMLSQRMAMFYLLDLYGIKDAKNAESLEQALSDYRNALNALSGFEGNTAQTREILRSLERGHNLLSRAVGQTDYNLSFLIATTSERMLADADKLTGLYVEIERKK